jgi:hypothetical protein
MYPKYIRTHRANGCQCSKIESQYTTDVLHTTYRPCTAPADYLLVGEDNGETFSRPRCAAHTIAAITDTGASGPLREYYSAHGKLPAPESMVEDAPEQAETMYFVRFAPQPKPGATVNDVSSSGYSAAGPFSRSEAAQFATQLAGRTALVYCKIVSEKE